MELKEQLLSPSLASKLGDVPHVSGLLRRLAHTSGATEAVADWLLKIAIQRGAQHYRLHIAELAGCFAPELHPWAYLRKQLPARPVPRTDALPHWSRLVSYTRVSPHGGPPRTDWLCRRE